MKTLFDETLPSEEYTVNMSESHIDTIFGAINDGILIADRHSIIRYVNRRYTEVLNLKKENIIGKPIRDVRPGSLLPDVIRSGEGQFNIFRKVEQNEYVVDMTPLVHQGKIVGGISLMRDIECVQQLSQKLQRYIQKHDELQTQMNQFYRAKYHFADLIGDSPEFRRVKELSQKFSTFDEDILILGESGVGKELFAQAMHNQNEDLQNKPFVSVNCPTLNNELAASELFGYSGGSFTGASKEGRLGLFSVANGGTIFLDEIADLPIEIQGKLLRVLQERKIRRIGQTYEEDIHVKVVAATNRDLKKMVQAGTFREDLYFRLSAITLAIPSLRDRRQDVCQIADYFLDRWCKKQKKIKKFTSGVYEDLLCYDWPGNVRELKNVIQFAAYASEGDIISRIYLPAEESLPQKEIAKKISLAHQTGRSLKNLVREYEREMIRSLMGQYGRGVEAKRKIAEILGISLPSLYNKLSE